MIQFAECRWMKRRHSALNATERPTTFAANIAGRSFWLNRRTEVRTQTKHPTIMAQVNIPVVQRRQAATRRTTSSTSIPTTPTIIPIRIITTLATKWNRRRLRNTFARCVPEWSLTNRATARSAAWLWSATPPGSRRPKQSTPAQCTRRSSKTIRVTAQSAAWHLSRRPSPPKPRKTMANCAT